MLYNILAILYIIGPVVGLWFIFDKAGQARWKALVPVYNIVVWIQVCRKNWKWYIYFLIPAINIFTYLMLVVETAKVFDRHNFWEQTFAVIFPFIYLPFLGLSKLQYQDPSGKPEVKYSSAREWCDAIVFALVAAVIIRGHCFEFYKIPSSSMEKSLLVGDYLMVSKMAYGSRSAMTPLSFPLVHNVMPLSNGQVESYLKWIQMPYHRFPGFGKVSRFDPTVFNYPDGDTVCTVFQSNRSYHDLVREYGRQTVYDNPGVFGKIVARPVDKKENFIKRCIGLPGETIEIRNQTVLINGQAIENPDDLEFNYAVRLSESIDDYIQSMLTMGGMGGDMVRAKVDKDKRFFHSMGISLEDCENSFGYYQYLYLNPEQLATVLRYDKYVHAEVMTHRRADSAMLVRLAPVVKYVGGNEIESSEQMVRMYGELELLGLGEDEVNATKGFYTIPLTASLRRQLEANALVAEVIPLAQVAGYSGLDLFPHADGFCWSVDNFGPITIPAKGSTVALNTENLPLYRRIIKEFEGNTLEVDGNTILINGQPAQSYTFKMDYYWMMGDNRHNSADSRYWGFVPENHVVGRASMIVFSRDADKHKVRWNRFFRTKL